MRRLYLRFSISTLLFIFVLVGGFFAGYRQGFHKGDFNGTSARIGYEFLEDAHFTTTHDITRLLVGNNEAACEFDPGFIVALIKDVVGHGPDFHIEIDVGNLVVAGYGFQHKEIAAIIDQLAHVDDAALAKLELRLGLNSSASTPNRLENRTASPSRRFPIARGDL